MRTSLTSSLAVVIAATIGVLTAATPAVAQQFVDGLAQPVFNVTGSNLITHSVWVEILDLDTDRDGINDRIRVQIRRPAVTNGGTRLPVVMVASPYSGGQLRCRCGDWPCHRGKARGAHIDWARHADFQSVDLRLAAARYSSNIRANRRRRRHSDARDSTFD